MRPASTNAAAKTTMAMVNTHEVCARVQPNSFSSGSTNTLQAYSEPRARFMHTPPITGSHRFISEISTPPARAFHSRRRIIAEVDGWGARGASAVCDAGNGLPDQPHVGADRLFEDGFRRVFLPAMGEPIGRRREHHRRRHERRHLGGVVH